MISVCQWLSSGGMHRRMSYAHNFVDTDHIFFAELKDLPLLSFLSYFANLFNLSFILMEMVSLHCCHLIKQQEDRYL